MFKKLAKYFWKPLTIGVLIALIVTLSPVGIQINSPPQDVSSPDLTLGQYQMVITIGPEGVYASGVADYTCDGVADDAQFQLALNALPLGGGKIVVLSGDYVFANTVSRNINNVTIEGVGRASYIANNGATALFSVGVQTDWVFRNLQLDWVSGITLAGSTSWELENVYLGATYYAYRTGTSVTADEWAIPTGRGATFVVAASDAPAGVKAQADRICDGTDDDIDIQWAIDAIEAQGEGSLIINGETINLSTGLVFTPSILDAAAMFSAYGVDFNYSGNGDAFYIGTNCIAGAGYAEKRWAFEGFNLYGTIAATAAIKVDTAIFHMFRDIYLSGFTGGKGIYLVDTGLALEQCSFFNITIANTLNPIYLYSDVALMCNTRMQNVTAVSSGANPVFQVAGSMGLQRCSFIDIIVKPGANSGIGFDFGSGGYQETVFINSTVEINFNNCTAYTATTPLPPLIISQEKPLVSDAGVGTIKYAGTIQNFFKPVYDQLLQIPHFAEASLLLPLKETQGSWAGDLSGNRYPTLLAGNPTWGLQGLFGNITLAIGKYGRTDGVSLDGDRTIIAFFKPDFAYDADVGEKYFFFWSVDANNLIYLVRFPTHDLYLWAKGNNQLISAFATVPWGANDPLLIVATIAHDDGIGTLYVNGSQIATNTNAAYNQSSTEANIFWGYASGAGTQVPTGLWSFSAILPRCIDAQEVKDLSRELLQMLGITYVTENSGTATISDNTTSVIVNHGLATTPTRIQLTPSTSTQEKYYWYSSANTTAFTINLNSAYAGADIIFDWRAVVGEGN